MKATRDQLDLLIHMFVVMPDLLSVSKSLAIDDNWANLPDHPMRSATFSFPLPSVPPFQPSILLSRLVQS